MSVTKFYPKDAAKDPDNVLEQAVGEYDSLIIVGWDKQGHLDVRSTDDMSQREITFILQKFLHKLMNGDYDVE